MGPGSLGEKQQQLNLGEMKKKIIKRSETVKCGTEINQLIDSFFMNMDKGLIAVLTF